MKIPMPNFRRSHPARPHKLDAAARRAPARGQDDFNEEPTMRLSSALVVVFILHLIAGGGLWAFSNFKAKHSQEAVQREVSERLQATHSDPAAPAPALASTPIAPKANANAAASAKSAPASPLPKDSGEVYVVQKGDNPVRIARHQNVNYDELLALNHIDDPRRLKIGQKLHLPVKMKHPAKAEHE